MKDVGLELYQAIYNEINGIADTYNAVPANASFPYLYIGGIVQNEATSVKDRFITYGTIDVHVYSETLTGQGSKSEMLTLTNNVKLALKPTKVSTLSMTNFNMTIWYISNESQREETTKDKKLFINTIQYYYEIEQI